MRITLRSLIAACTVILACAADFGQLRAEPAVEPIAPLRDEDSKDKSLAPLTKFSDDLSKVYYGAAEVSKAARLAYKLAMDEDIEDEIKDYMKDKGWDLGKKGFVLGTEWATKAAIRKILYAKAQRELKKKAMMLAGKAAELLLDDTVRVSAFAVSAFLDPNTVESKAAWERDILIIEREYYVKSWRKRMLEPVRHAPPPSKPSDITGLGRDKPAVSAPRARPSDITGTPGRVGGVKVDVTSEGKEEDLGAARNDVLKLLKKP